MTHKIPYSYVVLRYVHDVVSGEFVNVGVILVAPRSGEVLTRTRKTISRLRCVFPDLDRRAFVQSMRSVDRGIHAVKKGFESQDLFSSETNAERYARKIVPADDSSLQWSRMGSGVTSDPLSAFERLYERFVSHYDHHQERRVQDEDVWKPVKNLLDQRGLDLPLQKKVIRGEKDVIEFSRAWKNGKWHAYEPLSFDLSDADGIKDKARRWRGHLAAVSEGVSEDVKLRFIIAGPRNRALQKAYTNALSILEGSPFDPQLFAEDEAAKLVDEIEDEIRAHQES